MRARSRPSTTPRHRHHRRLRRRLPELPVRPARLSQRPDLPPDQLQPLLVWDWKHKAPGSNYPQNNPDVAVDLGAAMRENPHLKVESLNGWYDMATPFFGTEYDLKHMELPPALQPNLRFSYYPSGHMVYLNPEALRSLKTDVAALLRRRGRRLSGRPSRGLTSRGRATQNAPDSRGRRWTAAPSSARPPPPRERPPRTGALRRRRFVILHPWRRAELTTEVDVSAHPGAAQTWVPVVSSLGPTSAPPPRG